jgi:hypothetical protein
MNFDFKVIAKSFPAIVIVVGFACLVIGYTGWALFLFLVGVGSFVLSLLGNRRDR